MSIRSRRSPRTTLLVALAAGAALSGCREVGRTLGSGPSGASGADGLLLAVASRFGPIDREAGFDQARPRLAGAALVPSRVFDDEALWTASEGEWRQVDFFGERSAGRYRLGIRADAPPPDELAEYRGRLRLHRLEKGRFEWAVRDELVVGPALPDDLGRTLGALLRAGEGVSGDVARRQAQAAFPRATAAFSRLVTVDALELEPSDGGATAMRLALRLSPEGIRESAPRYAAFLRKFVPPMQLRVEARDATSTWWTLEGEGLLYTLRLRVRGGRLVALEGAQLRPVPEHLQLAVDYSTRQGPFRVGVRGLVADLTLVRREGVKAFLARFETQPDWRLPFFIEPFMRGSLRHPFEEGGIELSYSLRGDGAAPTRLVREYRLRVRESWIVRWLGGLSDKAVSEFRRGAEAEADRFSQECLTALREDVALILLAEDARP